MAKLSEAMKFLELKRKLELAQATINDLLIRQTELEVDRELLATVLCQTEEFSDWLMNQDLSSAHMRKPSAPKGAEVEEQDDLSLALAYATAKEIP